MWQDRGESGLRGSVSRALCAVHGCDNALTLSGVLSQPWETARVPGGDPQGQGAAAGPRGRVVRVLAPWPRRPEAPDASALRPGVHDLFRDDRIVRRSFPGTRNFPEPGAPQCRPGTIGRTGNTGARTGHAMTNQAVRQPSTARLWLMGMTVWVDNWQMQRQKRAFSAPGGDA